MIIMMSTRACHSSFIAFSYRTVFNPRDLHY